MLAPCGVMRRAEVAAARHHSTWWLCWSGSHLTPRRHNTSMLYRADKRASERNPAPGSLVSHWTCVPVAVVLWGSDGLKEAP